MFKLLTYKMSHFLKIVRIKQKVVKNITVCQIVNKQ